jgi:hypothetical protein|tara:strand:- start:13 stop:135 length:123 start_codon:yes stop_codon:yes gene_type:complete
MSDVTDHPDSFYTVAAIGVRTSIVCPQVVANRLARRFGDN